MFSEIFKTKEIFIDYILFPFLSKIQEFWKCNGFKLKTLFLAFETEFWIQIKCTAVFYAFLKNSTTYTSTERIKYIETYKIYNVYL